MFIHPNWTNNQNFLEDPITHHLRMVSGTLPWQSRVYLEGEFPSFVQGAGIRVFHNVNPGEESIYAMGMAQGDPQNVKDPADLEYGYIFDGTDIFMIAEGVILPQVLVEQNSVYDMRSDATDTVNWYVDGTVVNTFVGLIDYSEPWNFFVLGHTAFKTDLETQINPDGIDSLIVRDIVFDLTVVDETGGETIVETSVYGNAFVPATTSIFRCKMGGSFNSDTVILNENVFIERLIRPGEDPRKNDPPLPQSATRIPIDAIVPYNPASTSSDMEIFIGSLDEGDTLEFTIGTSDQPIYEDSTNPIAYVPTVTVFKLEGAVPEVEDEEALGEFFNDIYFKTRHLSSLIDIDDIVYKASDYFDFEYKVTEYNADEDTYNHVFDQQREDLGLEDTDRVLRFENQKTIEELFVKQYLPEYINYMKDINDPPTAELDATSAIEQNSPALIIDSGELEDLKNLLFKNITLMNYFKGNQVQMEFLISIFSSSLGWHYISVDPDPYHNFIYRVSTTMPERYWTENIRHITHPLGWDDFYVFVPRDAINWHQVQILDSTEAETYFLQHLERRKPSYIDYADYLDSTAAVEVLDGTGYTINRHYSGEVKRYGNYAGNAIFNMSDYPLGHVPEYQGNTVTSGDEVSEKDFPFRVDEYSAEIEYASSIFSVYDGTTVVDSTSGLFHELRNDYPVYDATTGYSDTTEVGYDGTEQSLTKTGNPSLFKATWANSVWTFEFSKSGLAGYYIWEVYNAGGIVATYKTHIPKVLHVGASNEQLTVMLRLKMKNWSTPIFSYVVDSNFRWLKNLEGNSWKIKETYLDQWAGSTIDRHDGALFEGVVNDPYRINDGDYQGELDSTSIEASALAATLDQTGTEFTVFFNDGTAYTEENMMSGIFTEFLWEIRKDGPSGEIINTIRTTIPELTYTSPGSRNVSVMLIRGELEYQGPNATV